MRTAFLVTTWIGLVACLVFVVAFHLRTGGAWRRSPAGRWLMLGRTNIGLLFLFVVLNHTFVWFQTWSGRDWVLLGLYFLFATQTVWPLRLLLQADPLSDQQREKSRDPRT